MPCGNEVPIIYAQEGAAFDYNKVRRGSLADYILGPSEYPAGPGGTSGYCPQEARWSKKFILTSSWDSYGIN